MDNQNIILKFTSNFNSKLNCRAFTTIRPRNDKKFILNHIYDIELKGNIIYTAQIISINHFMLLSLTDSMAYLDCGYNKNDTIKMIEKIYMKSINDVYNIYWSYICLFHDRLLDNI